MFELNVYFWGLICHVDENRDERADFAAVVRAGGHRPQVIFGLEPEDGYELRSNVAFSASEPAGIEHGDFLKYVPKLESIVGGVLAIDEGDAWRVAYAEGNGSRARLSVADTYYWLGIHKSKGSKQTRRLESPVARIVRLQVRRKAPITISFTGLDHEGRRVPVSREISSDTCIMIANLENTYLFDAGKDLVEIGNDLRSFAREKPDREKLNTIAYRVAVAGQNLQRAARSIAAADTNHFEHYSKLIAGGDTVIADDGEVYENRPEPSFACDWVKRYVGYIDRDYFPEGAVRTECANTNWP